MLSGQILLVTPPLTCSRGANYHLHNQLRSDPIGQLVISSPDLVLAVRGQIKGEGGGEGRGGNEIWQNTNLAHASTAHAPSLTCFSCVQYNQRVLLKTRFTKFKALKTQTVRDCKGFSAAGRHVLAVLRNGYMGKF